MLQHTIQAIQELAGVSDQALSKMMSELPVCDADNEGDSMVDSSASSAISAAASGLAQLAGAGHKSPLSLNLPQAISGTIAGAGPNAIPRDCTKMRKVATRL